MPGFDRTGPQGRGPLTGRGMGPCGAGSPGGYGRGYGRGFGRGYGFRRYQAYPDAPQAEPVSIGKDEQKKVLEEELKEIDAEKKAIEKKLKELE